MSDWEKAFEFAREIRSAGWDDFDFELDAGAMKSLRGDYDHLYADPKYSGTKYHGGYCEECETNHEDRIKDDIKYLNKKIIELWNLLNA